MRAYELVAGSQSIDGLRRCERPEPKPLPTQILVRIQAASLNYRDLMIARGHYMGGPLSTNVIPLSDGAGEVVAVGAAVTPLSRRRARRGHVLSQLDRRPAAARGPWSALGAPPADGVLAEYAVFDEQDAVAVPAHLSAQAAATLPCAAVTAWRALIDIGRLAPGETVLLIGTGGVSIFALQFARLAGARVLIISSSDEKLARARALGADQCINYRTNPEWEREVLKLTEGRGVDHVLEVGGAGTLGRSIASVAVGGRIALIGVLTGIGAGGSPYGLLAQASQRARRFRRLARTFRTHERGDRRKSPRTDRRSRIRLRRGRRGLSSSRERQRISAKWCSAFERRTDSTRCSLFAAARIRTDHGIRQSGIDRAADVPRLSRPTSATCSACRNRSWSPWPMASPRPAATPRWSICTPPSASAMPWAASSPPIETKRRW